MRLRVSRIVLTLSAGAAAAAAAQAGEDAAVKQPPPPTVVRFDPAAMPEPVQPTEGLGWRYANLSQEETRPLRRGFTLPMEALAAADSLGSLRTATRVAPLPDPRQPFLPVKPTNGMTVANPFTGSQVTSFRQDPMRALGELLGAVEGEEGSLTASSAEADPFAASATTASVPAAEVSEFPTDEAADDDPFATDDLGEDPFGF